MPDLSKLKNCRRCGGGRVAGRDAASLARVAGEYVDSSDGLPGADFSLLAPLKRSAEYGAIRGRVAELKPLDAWQLNDFHYFVFALRRADDAPADSEDPVALFAMNGESRLAFALVFRPDAEGAQADVQDLRNPGTSFRMDL
jgi:hypothetical protein